MGNINVGFFATIDEIIAMVRKTTQERDIFVVAVKIWPEFDCKVITPLTFEAHRGYMKTSRFIFLCSGGIRDVPRGYNEFLDQNINNLIIEVGEATSKYMKESTIGTRCNDAKRLIIWKQIITKVKKQMQQGAWVVNPHNGLKDYNKNIYYSKGALAAYNKGMVMKAYAGWSQYQLMNSHKKVSDK